MMSYMHWLVCKMNLPFHYYLLTVLVFHLYGFFFPANRGKNSLRKSNIKMGTVNNYWSLYLDSWGHISAFFIMFIAGKWKGKKKKENILDGNKSGLAMARTFFRSSSAKKHSCAEMFTLSVMLKQLVYHPNQYSKPPRFLSSLLVQ